MTSKKLSVLVVTKHRPEFIPWWVWNIAKQTQQPYEVIVVDSSPRASEWTPNLIKHIEQHVAPQRLEVLRAPSYYATGAARDLALQHVTGDVITWNDDDDWFHPKKFEWLMNAVDDKHPIAMIGVDLRLLLRDEDGSFLEHPILFPYRESIGYPHIPYMAFDYEFTKSYPIPKDKLIGEDTDWTNAMILDQGQEGWDRVKIIREHFPGMILIHGENTYHDRRRFDFEIKMDGKPLPLKAPMDVEEEEWIETLRQLDGLKERLEE